MNVASKICIIDGEERDLKSLQDINFQHPLLTYPSLQSNSNRYHYSYDNIDELLKTARYIYATLLWAEKPHECQFVISPSHKFLSLKKTYQIPFSLDYNKPAKSWIDIHQMNNLLSHISGYRFRYIDNLIIEQTLSLKDLPRKVNGDVLFDFDKQTCAFLYKAEPFEKCDLRYINEFIGFGVYAREAILRGEFVCFYYGVKTSNPEIKRYHFSSRFDVLGMGTDASSYSNIARFINHAPARTRVKQVEPSLLYANLAYRWYLLYGIEVVGFIALKNIAKGEQLLIDYGPGYFEPTEECRFNVEGKFLAPNGMLLSEKHHEKLNMLRIMAKHGISQAAYRILKRPLIALSIALAVFVLIYYM
ncbi:SET domain-containing protein-lysine N-methyltransferase [Legionella jamestowniensis]|uniref:SET domain-containing protein n=1 Tax=Legionella jamestowniensis TaxID=455 RepID=A0ABX2XSA7_9GAMM|nr:SET domain-containing protein-lysine N-methyltransferase [Legionella jamestowniensis]OCH97504.1 hypothetical protein A8135_14350 [Legionella jamestowniensis]